MNNYSHQLYYKKFFYYEVDEPIGNLDKENEQEIINILSDLAHKENKCVIIVSHSPEVKKNVDEVIYLTNDKTKDTKDTL